MRSSMKIARDNILVWTFAGAVVFVLLELLLGLRFAALPFGIVIGACVGLVGWSSFNRATTWTISAYSARSPVEVRAVARDLFDARG